MNCTEQSKKKEDEPIKFSKEEDEPSKQEIKLKQRIEMQERT